MCRLFASVKSKLMHYTWDLAICLSESGEEGYKLPYKRYSILYNPYKEKWFADPFILSFDGKIAHVLVEEYDSNVKRGRIAKLIIDVAKSSIIDCKIVLDIDTHLSYPAIYRLNDAIYVTPENADSGKFDLYRWNQERQTLELVQTVLNYPLADATILSSDEGYFLFTTSLPDPNGKRLSVFFSYNQFGDYIEKDSIIFPDNTARMAGAFFYDLNGSLIRPAQDCNGGYGNKVVFQKLSKSNDSWIMQAVSFLEPLEWRYAGIHTYNSYNNLNIIDLKKYDYPLLYKLKKYIKG